VALKHFHSAKVPSAEAEIILKPLEDNEMDHMVESCTPDKVMAQYHSPASSAQHLMVSS
jgi:hypothetical protein